MTRILAIGDVVGEEAAGWLGSLLPNLREQLDLDWIVVNAENCTVTGPSPMNGFGITERVLTMLLDGGVDVITGGNHSWDGPETVAALQHPKVVRPWNVDSDLGRGHLTLEHGESVLTVVNMLSPTVQLPGMCAPQPREIWSSWQALCKQGDLPGVVLVDFHGESTWEKASFAMAVDGEISIVVGTHTHDPTLRGHILPKGTGYVAELGMTGRLGFTGGGFDPAHFVADMKGEELQSLPPFKLATGPLTAGAMLIELNDDQRVITMKRLNPTKQKWT